MRNEKREGAGGRGGDLSKQINPYSVKPFTFGDGSSGDGAWWEMLARSNISIVRVQAWPSLSLMGGRTRFTNSSPYITPTFIPMTPLHYLYIHTHDLPILPLHSYP